MTKEQKPNRQRWHIEYTDATTGDKVQINQVYPVDRAPHTDENGWLVTGPMATSPTLIRGLVVEKVGEPLFDERFSPAVEAKP